MFSTTGIAKSEEKMISDITIYLERPILSEGGTVIVLPTEVDQAAWNARQYGENPAKNDSTVDVVRPISPADRRLGVVVSAPVSIVKFDFPEGGNYNFAFAPLDRENAPPNAALTKLLRNGRGSDIDPATNERVEVPRILVIHVQGSNASEDQTLNDERTVRFVAPESQYSCRRFENAIACDATKVKS